MASRSGTLTVCIDTIPHSDQRYDTVGDYQTLPTDYGRGPAALFIRVSELGDWRMNLCVALHELVEASLCAKEGITDAAIDAFDKDWKPHDGIDEPGDDLQAPYYRQHQQAMAMERAFAAMLEVHWPEYERRIDELSAGGV